MSARVVCISRELGAGGERIGALVAERLGLQYVDEDVIARAAIRGGVEPELIADTEERKSRLRKVVEFMGHAAPASGIVSPEQQSIRDADERSYRVLIRAVIEEVAEEGNAVIVAHAASMALAGRDGVLRVLVTGTPERRIGRLAASDGLDDAQAAKLVRQGDLARADYVKKFYGIDRELPSHYDLVVNTDVIGEEAAAEVVVHAATTA